jgi:hypothetical protein
MNDAEFAFLRYTHTRNGTPKCTWLCDENSGYKMYMRSSKKFLLMNKYYLAFISQASKPSIKKSLERSHSRFENME